MKVWVKGIKRQGPPYCWKNQPPNLINILQILALAVIMDIVLINNRENPISIEIQFQEKIIGILSHLMRALKNYFTLSC